MSDSENKIALTLVLAIIKGMLIKWGPWLLVMILLGIIVYFKGF